AAQQDRVRVQFALLFGVSHLRDRQAQGVSPVSQTIVRSLAAIYRRAVSDHRVLPDGNGERHRNAPPARAALAGLRYWLHPFDHANGAYPSRQTETRPGKAPPASERAGGGKGINTRIGITLCRRRPKTAAPGALQRC